MAAMIHETEARSPGAAMLENFRAGKNAEKLCQWPGSEGESGHFVMVPLSVDELQGALSASYKRWSSLGLELDMNNANDFHDEMSLQILWRSCLDADDPSRKRRLFSSADEMRAATWPHERNALADLFLHLREQVDPADLGELDSQIKEFVKKKDGVSLAGLSSNTLAAYIIAMDARPAS